MSVFSTFRANVTPTRRRRVQNELPPGETPTEAQPVPQGRVYGPITYTEYLATLSLDPQGGGGMMLMSCGCCDPGCGGGGNGSGCGCVVNHISSWMFIVGTKENQPSSADVYTSNSASSACSTWIALEGDCGATGMATIPVFSCTSSSGCQCVKVEISGTDVVKYFDPLKLVLINDNNTNPKGTFTWKKPSNVSNKDAIRDFTITYNAYCDGKLDLTRELKVHIEYPPEFISNADIPVYNSSIPDYYTTKIVGLDANTPLSMKITPVDAEKERPSKYSFSDGTIYSNGTTTNGFFKIDPNTGVISLNRDVTKDEAKLSYTLSIVVYEVDHPLRRDTATVYVGNWGVTRNNDKERATATSGMGCTIAELADEIGLNVGEYKQWLTLTTDDVLLADNTPIAASSLVPSDLLAAGQQFEIPNTIYMAWFGECGTKGQWWMSFNRNKAELEELGFSVFVFNNDKYDYYDYSYGDNHFEPNDACFDFTFDLYEKSYNKSLQGLYLMGHGSTTSVGSLGTNFSTTGPIWDIGYVDGAGTTTNKAIKDRLTYKLGALIIHACYGDNANARSLVSTNGGIFFGVSGVYTPFPGYDDFGPIAKFWGYKAKLVDDLFTSELIETFGGKQRTNPFSVFTFF